MIVIAGGNGQHLNWNDIENSCNIALNKKVSVVSRLQCASLYILVVTQMTSQHLSYHEIVAEM